MKNQGSTRHPMIKMLRSIMYSQYFSTIYYFYHQQNGIQSFKHFYNIFKYYSKQCEFFLRCNR